MSNIKYLQNNLFQAVESWKAFDSKDSRIEIFNRINNLAKYVAGKYHKLGGREDNLTFSYALDLLDRIITGSVVNLSGKEFYNYILVDFPKYLESDDKQVSPEIFNGLDAYYSGTPEDDLIHKDMFDGMMSVVGIFYSTDEVNRYLPLSIDIISHGDYTQISNLRDTELKYFCMLLFSLGVKLSRYYQKDVNALNYSEFDLNDISMLLLSVMDNGISRELFLSLDVASFNRLIDFAGGKRIRIPTRSELNVAMNTATSSIKYKQIEKEAAPFEENFGPLDSKAIDESTFKMITSWLEDNKNYLGVAKLDKLKDILS